MYDESEPPEYRGKKSLCVCAHACEWSLKPETNFNDLPFWNTTEQIYRLASSL